jgi:hypothetical protein
MDLKEAASNVLSNGERRGYCQGTHGPWNILFKSTQSPLDFIAYNGQEFY